jgi:branched-chain amino acid aminotransferase
MQIQYIDFNGRLVPENQAILTASNRGFRYGDGLFETMRYENGQIRFLTYHLERLVAGMKTLHLSGWENFTESFLEEKVNHLVNKNGWKGQAVRFRLDVYRDGEGLYSPQHNQVAYVLQASLLDGVEKAQRKLGLNVGLYTEHKKSYNSLSHLKSTNALIHVLAGNYRKTKGFDDVILLNQEGLVCESLHANIFVYYQKKLYTPALSEGCVEGVMRRVVIEMALDSDIEVIEAQLHPGILTEADEMFHTNAIQGVQWVMGFQHKRYFNKMASFFQEKLKNWPPKVESTP